ncbi:MAG: HAMP domain-containing sensor histidine kinase [Actinomycetota bacterium]
MQRRLMVAMVGIALAAVVVVGAGVLALAQIGARADTEDSVRDGLGALAELTERSWTFETVRGLDGVRTAFGLSDLGIVLIDDAGNVVRVENLSRQRRPRPGGTEFSELLTLTDQQRQRFDDGEVLFVDDPQSRGSTVLGLQRLDVTPGEDLAAPPVAELGLLGRKRVESVASGARLWFVVSALAVLALAGLAAWLLARRFTRPITAIERATSGIAAGDFDVRVEAEGDDELAGLARSVNRMAADLQRSKALDQQFLMSVSHDLRTPLTAISGYAEALRDGAATDPVHTGAIIGNQAARLERLVGDLLDLARLDANRFALHPRQLDVAVVAGRQVAGLQLRAEHDGLALSMTHEGATEAWADPDRLDQCIGKLIDNALKFATSRVEVTVGPAEGHTAVAVSDDGPGIAAHDLPHVFDRLYTGADQPARAENPTGMGLAIVRELMAAMDGSVTVASEPGGGTTMTLYLPPAPPAGS